MIQKIFDWTAGSFFRTIGRLLVFVIIGFLVAKLVDFSHFNWTDLLGIETVKADTYYRKWDTTWYNDANLTSSWTGGTTFMYKSFTTTTNLSSNLSLFDVYSSNNIDLDAVKGGHITIPFVIDFTDSTGFVNNNFTINDAVCSAYSQTSGGTYYCSVWNDITTNNYTDILQYDTHIQMNVMVLYTSNYNDVCEIDFDKNYISCPIINTNGLKLKGLIVAIKGYNPSTNMTYRLGLGDKINGWTSDTQSIINNQNDIATQQQSQHNETMSYFQDTNTTSSEEEASTFFEDFSVSDHGGLSSILTAPLTIVSKVLDDTCTPATFTYRNKQVVLPCGQYFWNLAPELRDWLSTIESGIIAYAILVALFKMIQRLESPSNSEVEVESL